MIIIMISMLILDFIQCLASLCRRHAATKHCAGRNCYWRRRALVLLFFRLPMRFCVLLFPCFFSSLVFNLVADDETMLFLLHVALYDQGNK